MKDETKKNTLDDIKDTVENYKLQGKIAVFVGAGVSTLSKCPSWSELVLDMAKRVKYPITLRDSEGKERLSSDEYLKIPQIFYKKEKKKKYNQYVSEKLNQPKEPNEIHKLIMQLNPNHILTTNYDTLLEQAANNAGRAYSVINSDKKVASAPTRNYILKVHGDFETNNFVLREDDYLDYENKFKLIDNLMKTIISTHLVIFVGYGLADYNIKLILNWVRHVQKKTFIDPIFLYTGKAELSDAEISYYECEHLRVIDANKLVDNPKKADYIDRYRAAMLALTSPERENKWYRTATWSVDHFYKLFEPIKDIKYMRIADMAKLFPESQIYYGNILYSDDFTYLFEAYSKKNRMAPSRVLQLDEIIERFRNSGVEGISNSKEKSLNELNDEINHGFVIGNDTFSASYQDIRERIDKYDDEIYSQYCKAYDLFWIGKLKEAMQLYYKLITESYKQKRWILYFFSQINLYYLRLTILQINDDLSGYKGILFFGKAIKLWSDDEIQDMRLSHILADIPAEIRRYSFLHKLIEKNYYKDDYVRMYKNNYEIAKEIAGEIISRGRTKDKMSKIRIFDAINFIYGNKITFDRFSEHTDFTKIALLQRFKGMLKQNELANREFGDTNNEKVPKGYFDFQEALIMVRTFTEDDLSVFYEKENGSQLILKSDSIRKFEKYVHELLAYFDVLVERALGGDIGTEYLSLRYEVKSALYLASYYVKTEEVVFECAQFLLCTLPNVEMNIHKRMPILKRYIEKMVGKDRIRNLLENEISERIQKCKSGEESILADEKQPILAMVTVINECFPGYKSKVLYEQKRHLNDKVARAIEPWLKTVI